MRVNSEFPDLRFKRLPRKAQLGSGASRTSDHTLGLTKRVFDHFFFTLNKVRDQRNTRRNRSGGRPGEPAFVNTKLLPSASNCGTTRMRNQRYSPSYRRMRVSSSPGLGASTKASHSRRSRSKSSWVNDHLPTPTVPLLQGQAGVLVPARNLPHYGPTQSCSHRGVRWIKAPMCLM